ncbi:hypothetical protein BB561_001677 [Smittium simulii]|uniref:Uncharacterized protein n=1 Tax=Smittium simulii TaxID=133385 RepID=A0A2T9YTI5_9FUNG|nr:hypothetical protein BB561_001677 [Smittium simulii]
MATPLLRRKPNKSILLKREKTKFKERGVKFFFRKARHRAPNKAIYVLPLWRTSFYVLGRICQTNQQSVGLKHYRKGIQNSFQTQHADASHTFVFHYTPLTIQKKTQQRANQAILEKLILL